MGRMGQIISPKESTSYRERKDAPARQIDLPKGVRLPNSGGGGRPGESIIRCSQHRLFDCLAAVKTSPATIFSLSPSIRSL